MGPGFKYHLATISAIFFALTVGLVVGSLTVSPKLMRTFNGALKGLNVTVRQDVITQRDQIARYRKFLDSALPTLIGGKLQGKLVTIVQTGDYSEPIAGIQQTLTQAGAQTAQVVTLDHTLTDQGTGFTQTLSDLQKRNSHIPTDKSRLISAIAAALVKEDRSSPSLLDTLQNAGLLNIRSDADYSLPVHLFIILAGSAADSTQRIADIDNLLILSLQHQGAVVVMAEPEDAAVSDVAGYQNLGIHISTVDDVDSDIGLCSLIYALHGYQGDFGVKPTARELSPLQPEGS